MKGSAEGFANVVAGDASESRTAVLGRIRGALGGTLPVEGIAAAEWAQLPREYKRASSCSREELQELLVDRLRDYDAFVEHVPAGALTVAIERRLAERGQPIMVIPAGLPPGLLPASTVFMEETGLSNLELDRFTGVLTMATLAIATTGTLVLQNVPGQGRRVATLIPDYHLCLVAATDVIETVPEAIRRLAGSAELPTTFISGPSATADIEMTRIKGVHGPRVLDVLIFDRDGR